MGHPPKHDSRALWTHGAHSLYRAELHGSCNTYRSLTDYDLDRLKRNVLASLNGGRGWAVVTSVYVYPELGRERLRARWTWLADGKRLMHT